MSAQPTSDQEVIVQGLPASPGIAFGQIFVYMQSEVEVASYQVDADKRAAEIARFEKALLVTRQQIAKIKSEVERNLGEDEARIFDAHLLVLEDQALISETIREFEATGANIEGCFQKVSQRYVKAFAEIDDEYLRERAGDIRDVAQRVLQNLLGQAENSLHRLADQRIVIANDLSPSTAASVDRTAALALVTDKGSRTSHAVIVARSMKIPAVVGVRDLTTRVTTGDWAIVDGYEGVVILHPGEQTLFRYGKIRDQKKSYEQRLLEANREPAVTLDQVEIPLMANIEKAEEVEQVRQYAGRGVG
ncbi:MAG: phosphoenolpyruvate-utilizing N-terminal domain-containing protein, partial [Opitutaceae bacterium]